MNDRINIALREVRNKVKRLDMHITSPMQIPYRPMKARLDTRELDYAIEGLERAIRDYEQQQREANHG
jgi:hypothetical protein